MTLTISTPRPGTRTMPPAVAPSAPPSIPPTQQTAWEQIVSGPKSKSTRPRHIRAKAVKLDRFA